MFFIEIPSSPNEVLGFILEMILKSAALLHFGKDEKDWSLLGKPEKLLVSESACTWDEMFKEKLFMTFLTTSEFLICGPFELLKLLGVSLTELLASLMIFQALADLFPELKTFLINKSDLVFFTN